MADAEKKIDERALLLSVLWSKRMVFKVPLEYLYFVGAITAVSLIIINTLMIFDLANIPFPLFWGAGVGMIFYTIGYIWAKIDPEFFGIYYTKIFKIGKTKGSFNGNRYLP